MSSCRSRRALYRRPMIATGVGVGLSLMLGFGKLAAGVLGGSLALIADAVNSLGDALVSAVVLAALWVAQRPPDEAHPYGHTRAEAVAASNAALLTTLSGAIVGWEALRSISSPDAPPEVWTLWVAAANAAVKEGLYRYKSRVGRQSGSLALVANAVDHRADALASLAVLVGLAMTRFGGSRFLWADAGAALLVAAMIMVAGVVMLARSSSDLLDRQAGSDLVKRVEETASTVPGVLRVETLRLRKSGLEYLADLHIEVDPLLTVTDGHAIGHRTKDRLLERFDRLRDVLVHVEPSPGGEGGDSTID